MPSCVWHESCLIHLGEVRNAKDEQWIVLCLVALTARSGPGFAEENEPNPIREVERLTLVECAHRALRRNGLLAPQWDREYNKIDPTADYREALIQARLRQIYKDDHYSWSPTLTGNLSLGRSIDGTPNALVDPRGRFLNTTIIGGIGLSGRLPPGTRYELNLTSSATWTTQNSANVSPRFENRLAATITQPLVRGAGVDYNTKTSQQTYAEQKALWGEAARLRHDIVRNVVRAYWTLWAAVRAADSANTMLRWGEALKTALKRRAAQGQVKRTRLLELQTALSALNGQVYDAQLLVLEAERGLLFHTYFPENEQIRGAPLLRSLEPVDTPTLSQEPRTIDALIDAALTKRGEVERLLHLVELYRVRANIAHNESLPQVDLSVTGGTGSLVGTSTFGRQGHSLVNQNPASAAMGSYGDAWGQAMWGDGLPFVNADLSVALPLHNGQRTYKARQAETLYRQYLGHYQSVKEDVAIQVRDAFLRHHLLAKYLRSAQQAATTVREQLASHQQQFKAGADNSAELIALIEQWGEARRTLGLTTVEFEISFAELLVTTGELVEHLGIQVPERDLPPTQRKQPRQQDALP